MQLKHQIISISIILVGVTLLLTYQASDFKSSDYTFAEQENSFSVTYPNKVVHTYKLGAEDTLIGIASNIRIPKKVIGGIPLVGILIKPPKALRECSPIAINNSSIISARRCRNVHGRNIALYFRPAYWHEIGPTINMLEGEKIKIQGRIITEQTTSFLGGKSGSQTSGASSLLVSAITRVEN